MYPSLFITFISLFSLCFAEDSASHSIQITIGIINEIDIMGDTVTLDTSNGEFIDGAIEVTHTSTLLDAASNQPGTNINAYLSDALPEGVELYMRVTGGRRDGSVTPQPDFQLLSTQSVKIATGADHFSIDDGRLEFKLRAYESASPITKNYLLTMTLSDS